MALNPSRQLCSPYRIEFTARLAAVVMTKAMLMRPPWFSCTGLCPRGAEGPEGARTCARKPGGSHKQCGSHHYTANRAVST